MLSPGVGSFEVSSESRCHALQILDLNNGTEVHVILPNIDSVESTYDIAAIEAYYREQDDVELVLVPVVDGDVAAYRRAQPAASAGLLTIRRVDHSAVVDIIQQGIELIHPSRPAEPPSYAALALGVVVTPFRAVLGRGDSEQDPTSTVTHRGRALPRDTVMRHHSVRVTTPAPPQAPTRPAAAVDDSTRRALFPPAGSERAPVDPESPPFREDAPPPPAPVESAMSTLPARSRDPDGASAHEIHDIVQLPVRRRPSSRTGSPSPSLSAAPGGDDASTVSSAAGSVFLGSVASGEAIPTEKEFLAAQKTVGDELGKVGFVTDKDSWETFHWHFRNIVSRHRFLGPVGRELKTSPTDAFNQRVSSWWASHVSILFEKYDGFDKTDEQWETTDEHGGVRHLGFEMIAFVQARATRHFMSDDLSYFQELSSLAQERSESIEAYKLRSDKVIKKFSRLMPSFQFPPMLAALLFLRGLGSALFKATFD